MRPEEPITVEGSRFSLRGKWKRGQLRFSKVDQAAIKTWEAVMLPHEQMVVGVGAGLFFYTILYWSPGWRHLLAAVVAAGLTDFALISHVRRELDLAGAFATQPGEILGATHFRLGVALAFASVSAALRTLRQNNN